MKQIAHLARRFFGSLGARRPTPTHQQLIAEVLSPAEASLFWDQPVADLDHAVRTAVRVRDSAPDRTDLMRAALLHDIGKRHARLGTIGRSVITVLAAIRLPVGVRGDIYLDHGSIGARELADIGSESIVVRFAAHHHGPCPADVDPADWAILSSADDE